ncbi:MAG: methyltransferase domain-containing protein, partial [Piptocephalis tieghemiana]
LSSLIHQVARETRVRLVLDLGSGQGYLGRTLAFQKGLRVCAIDASSIQTSGALHLTQRAGKGRDEGTRGRLQHLTHTLGGGRIMEIPDQGKGEEATRWMVCGLHGCGDLTSHTLRLFAHGDASALVSVGCCYNLLTTSNPEATARGPGGPDAPRPPHPGFPMSRLVGEGKEALTLPTAAFQLACQTPGRWRVQREETIRGFTHHYYRSLLHLLMLQEGLIPSGSKESAPRVGRLRPRAFRDFGTYVSMAMTKMGMEEKGREMGESKALDLLAHGEKQGWAKHIAALWSLRALLAPCIESLIVLDRWFFLKEQGVSRAWILSGWEEEVSPRNLILIAQRSS